MKLTRGAKLLRRSVKPAMSPKKLAGLLGCDQSLVSLWATGRRVPGRDMAVQLEKLLGIPVADWSES